MFFFFLKAVGAWDGVVTGGGCFLLRCGLSERKCWRRRRGHRLLEKIKGPCGGGEVVIGKVGSQLQ